MEMSYTIHSTNITWIDFHTTVSEAGKKWIRNDPLLLPHNVRVKCYIFIFMSICGISKIYWKYYLHFEIPCSGLEFTRFLKLLPYSSPGFRGKYGSQSFLVPYVKCCVQIVFVELHPFVRYCLMRECKSYVELAFSH